MGDMVLSWLSCLPFTRSWLMSRHGSYVCAMPRLRNLENHLRNRQGKRDNSWYSAGRGTDVHFVSGASSVGSFGNEYLES